ncbi:AlpA family transcriptional regulator [Nitrosomonas sp. Nm34]|uniref:AlpA family transcriptional regulator n=1 Tax=Nitrosomonas sp. Nm34 TaxID=1881055 RepID=UPI0008E5E55A|nr:AlpA family transcriptional regulator [Nitrosomonas sp. Nm34]SFI39788.1 prophage regulatory protein [Nitrosomonas sp. Nm34]
MSKFIRLDQVKTITGLSRSSIYQFIKDGKFPSQVKLGARSVAWVASEIEEWMSSCIAKRGNP